MRHVLLSASVHDSYAGVALASVRDPIENYNDATSIALRQNWLAIIQHSLSFFHFAVNSAEFEMQM